MFCLLEGKRNAYQMRTRFKASSVSCSKAWAGQIAEEDGALHGSTSRDTCETLYIFWRSATCAGLKMSFWLPLMNRITMIRQLHNQVQDQMAPPDYVHCTVWAYDVISAAAAEEDTLVWFCFFLFSEKNTVKHYYSNQLQQKKWFKQPGQESSISRLYISLPLYSPAHSQHPRRLHMHISLRSLPTYCTCC